jgi:two-component system response regulator AtoC
MIVLGDPLLTRSAFAGAGEPAAAPAASELPAPAPVAVAARGPAAPAPALPRPISLKQVARQAALAAERDAILRILEQTRWNRVRAAKLLGISYRALLYKIKDITGDGHRPEPAP